MTGNGGFWVPGFPPKSGWRGSLPPPPWVGTSLCKLEQHYGFSDAPCLVPLKQRKTGIAPQPPPARRSQGQCLVH